jgi:hypothetical protein
MPRGRDKRGWLTLRSSRCSVDAGFMTFFQQDLWQIQPTMAIWAERSPIQSLISKKRPLLHNFVTYPTELPNTGM